MRSVMFVAAIVPALVILLFFQERDRFSVSSERIWNAFALGAVMAFPVIGLVGPINSLLGLPQDLFAKAGSKAFFHAAIPEEAFKLIAIAVLLHSEPHSERRHGIIALAAAVSIGFAAFENMFYIGYSDSWSRTAFFRSVTSVPSHAYTGAIMGACLAFRSRGIRNWIAWSGAFFIPMVLHGAYDFFAMVSDFIETDGILDYRRTAEIAIVIFVSVVVLEGLLAFFSSNLILKTDREDGVFSEGGEFGRLLQWWLDRPNMRRMTWRGIAMVMLFGGPYVALTPLFGPTYAWTASFRAISGEVVSSIYVLVPFGIFAALHGIVFLIHARFSYELGSSDIMADASSPPSTAPPPPSSSVA